MGTAMTSGGSAPAQPYPPLYAATLVGDRAGVARLLRTPVDVNWRNDDNHWPALMVAADAGNADIVAELLTCDGVEVNATDDLGQTPLHIAADQTLTADGESEEKVLKARPPAACTF